MTLICFASPKGGVGKTTLAANVANELSREGLRVIALDLDPQNALRLHFGVSLQDTAGFTHLLARQLDWQSCLREMPCGLSLLPYGSSGTGDAVALAAATARTPALLQRPIREMLASPDICVVVDTPPGPSALLAALLPMIDLLVIVLMADAASMSLIPVIEHGDYGTREGCPSGPALGFVLNQFDPRTRLSNAIADAASTHFGERLLGIVYRDGNVGEAVAAQKLMTDYAPASKARQDIAAISHAILDRLHLVSGTRRSERQI